MNGQEISAKISSQYTINEILSFDSKDIFIFDEGGKRVKSN